MSLEDWLANGWLTEHLTSKQEIADLLGAADRDLASAGAEGLATDWKHNIAYNAALRCAAAALAACGYRARKGEQHYRLVHSFALTLGPGLKTTVRRLETARKKRHLAVYERPGAIGEAEAEEVLSVANQLREDVKDWLRENHSELVSS